MAQLETNPRLKTPEQVVADEALVRKNMEVAVRDPMSTILRPGSHVVSDQLKQFGEAMKRFRDVNVPGTDSDNTNNNRLVPNR